MKLLTKAFWADLAERTIATGAQAAIATLAVESGLTAVDWAHVASIAGLAALIAALKCLALIRRTADQTEA